MSKNPAINDELAAMGAFTGESEGTLADDFRSPAEGAEMIDMDTSDVYEEIVHPTGAEVKLRALSCDKGTNKNGATYYQIRYEDANNKRVKVFSYFLNMIGPKDDERQKNNRKKAFAAWKAAHGFPTDEPVDMTTVVGAEAWALLRQTESEEYGLQNEVRRWIVGGAGSSL